MRELLIRYLLGELDATEQRRLEDELRDSPTLQRELAHLQTCFAAARDIEPCARRAAVWIGPARHRLRLRRQRQLPRRRPKSSLRPVCSAGAWRI